jgi:hypothetical protein
MIVSFFQRFFGRATGLSEEINLAGFVTVQIPLFLFRNV